MRASTHNNITLPNNNCVGSMGHSKSTSILLFLLLGLQLLQQGALAQFTITATTPSSTGSGPNTFIGTVGNQIAASLLAASTPVLLWGAVSSDNINTACQQIVNTGSLSFTASVSNDWGGSEDLTLQVQNTGGCLAASDASGTEFVFTDNYGRKSAIVCPSNAGSSGCGVYMTGDDINQIYNSNGGSKRKLLGMRKLLDCKGGAGEGAVGGAITGVLGAGECLALGPLAPFCVAGVLGVSAELGALAGCVSSCFPGDAMVQTENGGMKPMSELSVGDKIAVWDDKRAIAYHDVYAFGHKDPSAVASFLEITMEPARSLNSTYDSLESKTLQITAMHFLPTSADIEGQLVYKRARDIEIGDIMWAAVTNASTTDQALPHIVVEISMRVKHGLYNPFTMGGTIVVDRVVASVHSDWFLDTTFSAFGLVHWLPVVYQFVLTPARILYLMLGKDRYIIIYNWLDAHLDVAKFGTAYGGAMMFATYSLVVILATTIAASKASSAYKMKSKM